MPELPEVESLRRSLLPYILNQKIVEVEVLLPKIISDKGTKRIASEAKTQVFVNGLEGQQIIDLTRTAKNLILHLKNGSLVLIHLKMTGQLVFEPDSEILQNLKAILNPLNKIEIDQKNNSKNPNFEDSKKKQNLIFGGHPIELSSSELPNKHTRIIFELSNGKIFYNDVRQFGYLLFYPDLETFEKENHFIKLGLEPLSETFELQIFSEKLKKQTGILKKVFLEQKAVVGLGNIYSDEVCFEAKVRPDRLVKTLKTKEIKALFEAIKKILVKAVRLNGSSISNYLLADGSRGNYAREHKVYNRAGKPCLVCQNTLKKIQLSSRTTVFCEVCQS